MGAYALRRLLLIVPTLLIVMGMIFLLVALLPGDAVDAAGSRGAGARSEESKEVRRAKLGLDQPLPIQFVAWFVGWPRSAGVVVGTRDGGATWAPLSESLVNAFNDVAFVSERDGWAVDDGGGIYRTNNGGIGWENQLKENESALTSLAFIDAANGWAVGEHGTVYHTSDGGESWQRQTSDTEKRLTGVLFLDAEHGWVVGDGGTILSTSDGGATWLLQTSNTDGDLATVTFTDRDAGWAVGEGGVILRTKDGGSTWAEQASGTSTSLTGVDFVDANQGWVVGKKGLILHTTDGGRSWTRQEGGVGRDLTGVDFLTASAGRIVGEGGLVLLTADGGSTWAQGVVNPLRPITKDLRAVTFVNENVGWAVGWNESWKWGLLGGNLGRSMLTNRTAVHELGNRIPRSLELMALAVLFSIGLGIPIGVLAAIRQDTVPDYLGRGVAIIGLSVPAFWLGTLVILLPAVWWQWTPPLEYRSLTEDPVGNLKFFALPAFVLGFGSMAGIMRMTRATMLEVLRQDYIRTASAKGLRERAVVARHALKNALIPVVTIIGIQIPFLLGESVVVEFIFRVPGMGILAWTAVTQRDYPIVQAVVLFVASGYIIMNLVVDLTYGWLDPRIRYA